MRPSPHWISSAISSAPVRSHTAFTAAANAGVNGHTPPSPWTGSRMIAATSGPAAASSAPGSVGGTKLTPGTSGSNGRRYPGSHVVDSAPNVRPWNERSSATIFVRAASPRVCQ